MSLAEKRDLLDLCQVLFEPKSSLMVKLVYPLYFKCYHLGKVSLPGFIYST